MQFAPFSTDTTVAMPLLPVAMPLLPVAMPLLPVAMPFLSVAPAVLDNARAHSAGRSRSKPLPARPEPNPVDELYPYTTERLDWRSGPACRRRTGRGVLT